MDTKDLSDKELDKLLKQAQVEKRRREDDAEVEKALETLKTRDGFHDLITDMISEWWVENNEKALRIALQNLGVSATKIDRLVDLMGDASNTRSELQQMSDEDDDYGSMEDYLEKACGRALDTLDKMLTKAKVK